MARLDRDGPATTADLVVTAVRNGSGNLFMILWDVPTGLGSITRTRSKLGTI